jgi:cullin 1
MPFLSAMEVYYKHKSDSFIVENSVLDYLKKAKECLKEEEDRIERYLHTTTHKLLITKCKHILVHACRAHVGELPEFAGLRQR